LNAPLLQMLGFKVKKSFGGTNFMQTIKNSISIHEAKPKHTQAIVLPSKSLGRYPRPARRYSIEVVNQPSKSLGCYSSPARRDSIDIVEMPKVFEPIPPTSKNNTQEISYPTIQQILNDDNSTFGSSEVMFAPIISFETQGTAPKVSFEVQKPEIEESEIVQPIVIEGTAGDKPDSNGEQSTPKPEKDTPNKNEIAKVSGDELNEIDPKILQLIDFWDPTGYDALSIEEKIKFREEEAKRIRETIQYIIQDETTKEGTPTFIKEYKCKRTAFYCFKPDSRGHSSNLSLINSMEALKKLKSKIVHELNTDYKIELLMERHEESVYNTLTHDQKIGYLKEKLIKLENYVKEIIQKEKNTFKGINDDNGVKVYKFTRALTLVYLDQWEHFMFPAK
jgi:hypothetical protein